MNIAKRMLGLSILVLATSAWPTVAHAGWLKCTGGGFDKEFDNIENINVSASGNGSFLITFRTIARLGADSQKIILTISSATSCEAHK